MRCAVTVELRQGAPEFCWDARLFAVRGYARWHAREERLMQGSLLAPDTFYLSTRCPIGTLSTSYGLGTSYLIPTVRSTEQHLGKKKFQSARILLALMLCIPNIPLVYACISECDAGSHRITSKRLAPYDEDE